MMNYCIKTVYCGIRPVLFTILFSIISIGAFAQDAGNVEKPKDVKVISEKEDGNGNIIRKVQYKSGSMIVTETIIMPKPMKVGGRRPINLDTMDRDSIVILVDKSHYSLMVFYKRRLIRSYRAVFGPNPDLNKQMEGDRNTPEGWFTITRLNPRSKYNKFMEISYPNDKYRERFENLKKRGVIPRNARIGGNVGIHGIWEGGDNMIQLGVGWTDGCIALTNSDMNDLYSIAGIGTRIFIKK